MVIDTDVVVAMVTDTDVVVGIVVLGVMLMPPGALCCVWCSDCSGLKSTGPDIQRWPDRTVRANRG